MHRCVPLLRKEKLAFLRFMNVDPQNSDLAFPSQHRTQNLKQKCNA
jgi:hypothetical protein